MNRTIIVGRRHIPRQSRGTIIASNHETMLDSFGGGTSAYPFWVLLVWPSLAPYHLAAKENFFKNWAFRFILKHLRAIPIDRGKFNRELLDRLIALLQKANVWIFYQGTRSYDLDKARNGAAYLIANCLPTPTVTPAYLKGIDKLIGGKPGDHHGIARYLPRFPGFGRKAIVAFGPPIDFSEVLKNQNDPELYDKITALIVGAVKKLRDEVEGSHPELTEGSRPEPGEDSRLKPIKNETFPTSTKTPR